MQDVKKAYAWQEALELSKRLVSICEEFSDADTNVLVWHLRQAVVDIPAGVAADLQAGRDATMEPIVKLITELELVHRIYPAIDTAAAEDQMEKLMGRMQSDNFAECEPEPADEQAGEETPAEDDAELPMEDEGDMTAEPASQPAGGTIVKPQVDGVAAQPVVTINPEDSSRIIPTQES